MRNGIWLAATAAVGVVAGVLIDRHVGPLAGSGLATEPPYNHVGTIREIMHGIVEPSSDAIFDAVVIDVSAAGIKETLPRTEEEWEKVEHGAIALAEAVNLLKMPGRAVARPEEMNVDPEGPELPPSEIAGHISRSPQEWNTHADGLQRAAIEAMNAARAKSVEGLTKVGETLDNACESCHLAYWYPDDAKNRKE